MNEKLDETNKNFQYYVDKLVGTDEEVIYDNFKLLLEDQKEYEKMSRANNPYGDGFASKRIADILEGR